MKNLLTLLAFLFITQFSIAQSALKLPDTDPEMAKEKYALLTDHYDSKEYQESYEALLWIMDHAPDMHESVYILGQKTITKLLDETPLDSDLKESLLRAYDYRIRYFGNEVKVLNRKAFDAYKYCRNDLALFPVTIEIFDQLYEKEKNKLKENLLYPYFDLKVTQRKNDQINNEELIEVYENISEIISTKLEEGDNENLEKVQKLIDAKLADSIPLDCDKIDRLFAVKSDGVKYTLTQAKLILKLSLAYECTQESYFIEAIKVLFEKEPTMKLARIIASYHLDKKEYPQAIEYFNKSLESTHETHKKSLIYFDIATVYSSKGDKIKAREMAYNSLKLDPDNLNCYRLIGDLYYNSFDDCKKSNSRVEDRSVFYAAYEKYALAKDQSKMSLAEQQFPTMEDIHTENFVEGQVINTNCWIGENVKIRRRPSMMSNQ